MAFQVGSIRVRFSGKRIWQYRKWWLWSYVAKVQMGANGRGAGYMNPATGRVGHTAFLAWRSGSLRYNLDFGYATGSITAGSQSRFLLSHWWEYVRIGKLEFGVTTNANAVPHGQ